MQRSLGLSAALCLAVIVPAQNNKKGPSGTVVPLAYAKREAPNAVFWALSPFSARRQLILDQGMLAAAAGRAWKALSVRRDAGNPEPHAAGIVGVSVTFSTAATVPRTASNSFTANRGKLITTVFSGNLQLPSTTTATSAPVPWTSGWTARMPFSKPYVHKKGLPLCIETVTTPWTNSKTKRIERPWWPIDGVHSGPAGTVVAFGKNCIGSMPQDAAGAESATIGIGRTGVHWLRGPRTTGTAFLIFGLNDKTIGGAKLPLDLTNYGAPGCELYVEPMLMFPRVNVAKLGSSAGLTTFEALIPHQTSFAGVSYVTQWAMVDSGSNGLGLTFSNAVRARLASSSQQPVAWIENEDPKASTGRVLSGRLPVLRFEY